MRSISHLILPVASLLFASTSLAQSTSKEGYALEWDKTITVVPDSMSAGKRMMAAWTVSVFEADASEALDMWKADMKPISQGVSGSRPMKAVGALVPGIGSGIVAFASSITEKKPKHARLTVAFAMNDTTPLASNAGQEAYVRALAVKYNRAVVQQQIDGYEKMLGKAGDKLSGTQDDVSKSRTNIAKGTSKLKKVEAQRGKVQGDIARQQVDIAGLEKKFSLSNEAKDLSKLTKSRGKLSKLEGSLAKLMQQEAGIQGDLAGYQHDLEGSSKESQQREMSKEEVQRVLDALKRKHDAIM